MKKFILLPLALFAVSMAHADTRPTKAVQIPFHNEKLVSKDHVGLYFDYDMNDKPSQSGL